MRTHRDRLRWSSKTVHSHRILVQARHRLICVEEGRWLLSYCGKGVMWGGEGNTIQLERLVKAKQSILNRYHPIGECWNEEVHGPQDRSEQCQHAVLSWNTRAPVNGWNSVSMCRKPWLNVDGNLCSSRDWSQCICHHCRTTHGPPSDCCDCPKCSDPVSGERYYKALSGDWH